MLTLSIGRSFCLTIGASTVESLTVPYRNSTLKALSTPWAVREEKEAAMTERRLHSECVSSGSPGTI
jgi:hypothetical protein